MPPRRDAEQVLENVAQKTGLVVSATNQPPAVEGYRLKLPTRVGLWRVANNMPGGWMMWLFEQYGIDHRIISAEDFRTDLADQYDVIVLPAGTTQDRIVNGLDRRQHDESWRWAFGIGDQGWNQLRQWVSQGGTLVTLGSAVGAARELLNLPIESVLPQDGRSRIAAAAGEQSLNRLDNTIDPNSVFYAPGSLVRHSYNTNHPVAYGMPSDWPIFFRLDQAYRVTPDSNIPAEIVSSYPDTTDMTVSGWLLGGAMLRNRANAVSFSVGRGTVVTIGSQATFRAQTRATFKLLFNAIFYGPATKINAQELAACCSK